MNDFSTESAIRALDPFGFFIGHASCIRPLGGTERGPDPTYAFHTSYMEYRPGPVVFTIRIDKPRASFGELVIHVNSFVPGSGSHALLVTMSRISIVDLVETGSEIVLRINALANVGYAIFGYFPEGTDAIAAGLTIDAEELGTIEDEVESAGSREPTRFGTNDLDRPGTLVTDEPILFKRLISQIMTAPQLVEDDYSARLRALSLAGGAPAHDWKRAFVFQALDRYGFIAAGAHGLSLGDAESPLAASLAARDAMITVAMHIVAEGSVTMPTLRRYPAICPAPLFDARCSLQSFDPTTAGEELRGYDFLWSIDRACDLAAVGDTRNFVFWSLRCLRPRGLAVHMFDVMPEGEPNEGVAAISRLRLESLVLTLISRGNDVAQLNFGDGTHPRWRPGQRVPFGLVIRRGI